MAEITKLSNGIRVVTEYLSFYRTASFGIWVRAGSSDESKEENGISHMIEHMLFKGTENRSAKDLADIITGIGDDVNAFTSKEYTSYYGTTVTEYLPRLIDLLGDMLLHSKLDEKEIRKEKRVIAEEIDMYEDSPEDLVHELLQKSVWRGHSLGYMISGSKSNVKSFQRKDLIDFMKRYYTAERMVISVAGNFEQNKLLEQLEQVFGIVASGKEPKSAERPFPQYQKSFCIKHKSVEQIHVNMAFPAISLNSPERYTFAVMNSLLGGSNNSRLFQHIREELGLAYSVYSYPSEYEQAGLFHIDVTVNPTQVFSVLNEIITSIREFTCQGLQKAELDIHKSQIKTELIMNNESIKSKMSANAKSVFLRGYVISLDENLNNIDKVDAKDVEEICRRYFKMAKASLCLVGPRDEADIKKIRRWLKELENEK